MSTAPGVIEVVDALLAGDETAAEPNYGENNKDLPENLQNALRALVKHFASLDKTARRDEVINACRQRNYWRGLQYIYWDQKQCVFATAAAGASIASGSASVDMPRYTDVYNIYQRDGLSVMSVLVQNPVPMNFIPDDPMDPQDITAAAAADKFKHVIDTANKPKELQAKIARLFWTDGRVVLYTHMVGEKEIIEANGVLESKLPITADTIKDFAYAILSKELDINMAKGQYKDFASKIKKDASGVGESSYERNARLGVLQGSRSAMQGDAFAHMVTRQMCWLRPDAFDEAVEEAKEPLKELFPAGCLVTFVGDAYCGSREESMDDCLAIAHGIPGDGQNRPSMGHSLVPIQDAFNDYKNLEKEIFDYSVPTTWMDNQLGDIEALREQVSEPGNHVPVTRGALQKIEDGFYREPDANCPASMIAAYQDLRELGQALCGALPALLGEADSSNTTKGGIEMLRDQAMAQISIPWGAMQEAYATAYPQAIKLAANNRPEDEVLNIAIPVKKVENDSVAIADLKKGKFRSAPNTDGGFPETFAQKSARFMELMEQAPSNPSLAQIMMQPDNMQLAKEMIGLEDLVIPGAEAQEKQLEEIELLLQASPVPPTPEQMTQAGEKFGVAAATGEVQGPPPTEQSLLRPSIDVQRYDYHQYEFEECRRWLSSKECREQEKAGNFPGIENVRLHAAEHEKFMQQEMMAQQAMQQANEPEKKKPEASGEKSEAVA